MTYKPPRRPQFFYTTAPLPCPYVGGRTERKVVTEITGPESDQLHDRLSRAGFRRSHNIAYAPVCPGCNACIPIRVRVADFQPDRTLRRVRKANAGLDGFEVPARATAEQFQLFQRYQQARHHDGDMATMSFYDYRAMVEDTPINTFIAEFRDEGDRLALLVTLVELYESARWPIAAPDPIESIRFMMDQKGLSRRDLEPAIGARNRVAEILNRKRPLTLSMIRRLSILLELPADILVQSYDTKRAA